MASDLSGCRFGRLTVVSKTDKRRSGRVIWICRCDCGNTVEVTTSHLTQGNTTSCGCARIGVNSIDMTGQRFGRLVVLYPTDLRSGNSVIWHCQCDCGGESDVSAANLRNGYTRSCGCLASKVHSGAISAARDVRDADYIDGTDVRQLLSEPKSNNTSGVVGVSYDKSVKLWKAYISFKGKKYYLGSSTDKDKAVSLRREAEQRIHGEFLDWYNMERKEANNG